MKKLIAFVLAGMMVWSIIPAVYGAEELAGGFVEYETTASVNFNGMVSVTLANIETGATYTHDLYKINDYKGNFKVPFGSYRAYARTLSESETDVSYYTVNYPKNIIVVDNAKLAVPISLSVEAFTPIEPNFGNDTGIVIGGEPNDNNTATENVGTAGESSEEESSDVEETTKPDDEETTSVDSETATDNVEEKEEQPKKKNSFWASTLGYAAFLVVMCVAYLVYKRKYEKT